MATMATPRPLSSQSKSSTKSNLIKFKSPQCQVVSPTSLATGVSHRSGFDFFSPQHKTYLRPFSAETMSFGSSQFNFQGFQDEVIMDSFLTCNPKTVTRQQSSKILNQMTSVLKPKKAMSAVSTQKSKRSPLLIYKDTLTQQDEPIFQGEAELDFSKQYSIIQLKKQQLQNKNKLESGPFGKFQAFRKEKSFTSKKNSNKDDSFKANISQSKFFSRPIYLKAPQTATNGFKRDTSLDITKATTLTDTATMKESNGFDQNTINQTNQMMDNLRTMIVDDAASAQLSTKKIHRNTFVVQKHNENSSTSPSLHSKPVDNQPDQIKTIDQRISLSSVFLMNIDQNKHQVSKFLQGNQQIAPHNVHNKAILTSTQNTGRSTHLSSYRSSTPKDNKQNLASNPTEKSIFQPKLQQTEHAKPQSALTKLQLWPQRAETNFLKGPNNIQQDKDELQQFNFVKTARTISQNSHKQKQKKIKTEQNEKKEKNEAQIILDSIPDYKFDSTNKQVASHIDLKAKKIFFYDKTPKTPLMQIHFQKRQREQKVENNKMKYCESAEYVGEFSVKPSQSQQKKRRYNQKNQEDALENSKLLEYDQYVKMDKLEKAAIRERNRQIALLNFSNFSDAQTEKILDDDMKPDDVFPNASKWIVQSPVSQMLESQFPLVKNYVDKIWSYYKEFDEIQEFDENNQVNHNQVSIKAIDEQADTIKNLYDQINRMNSVFASRIEKTQNSVPQQQIDDFLKSIYFLNLIIQYFTRIFMKMREIYENGQHRIVAKLLIDQNKQ